MQWAQTGRPAVNYETFLEDLHGTRDRQARPPHAVAGTASAADDVAGALHEVVAAAALLLAADGAGVMLADRAHALRWVTATGEAEQTFERAQRDLGEGPCIDAFLLDQVVWTEDLRVDRRWPRLGPAGRTNQIRGVLSAPVGLAGRVLGTCNVITWTPRPWTVAEIKSIGAFAFVIGRLLGVTSEARHMGDLATQLQGALDSRILIEQAKGVLMECDGLSDLEAFDRLRRQARSRSSTINDVAREIIANRARRCSEPSRPLNSVPERAGLPW
jgi:hypothetical protein